jgi:hypothetical protein
VSKIKENCIPKNVLSLEKLFDLQTKFIKPMNMKTNNSTMMHFLVNLGTLNNPNTSIWALVVQRQRSIHSRTI